MQDSSRNHYRLVERFVHGCLDKRTGPYKSLKRADASCREAVEDVLSKNQELKKVIASVGDEAL